MNQYMGGYFKCLMVYGELPQLGVADNDLKKSAGKCSVRMSNEASNFALQTSGQSIGTLTANTSKNAGATEKTASSRGNSGSQSKATKGKKSSRESSSESSSGDSDSSYSSSLQRSGDSYGSGDSEGQIESVRSTSINPAAEPGKPTRVVSSQLESDLKKKQNIGLEARSIKGSRSLAQIDDPTAPRAQPRKFAFPQPKTDLILDDESQEDTGYGYYLKWLIIIGIGIALFVLLGGQIMNYRNSDSG
jgi:hypothetical protein